MTSRNIALAEQIPGWRGRPAPRAAPEALISVGKAGTFQKIVCTSPESDGRYGKDYTAARLLTALRSLDGLLWLSFPSHLAANLGEPTNALVRDRARPGVPGPYPEPRRPKKALSL